MSSEELKKGDRVFWKNTRGFRSTGKIFDIIDGVATVEGISRWFPATPGSAWTSNRWRVPVDRLKKVVEHGQDAV
jgi:hypothetical protein